MESFRAARGSFSAAISASARGSSLPTRGNSEPALSTPFPFGSTRRGETRALPSPTPAPEVDEIGTDALNVGLPSRSTGSAPQPPFDSPRKAKNLLALGFWRTREEELRTALAIELRLEGHDSC